MIHLEFTDSGMPAHEMLRVLRELEMFISDADMTLGGSGERFLTPAERKEADALRVALGRVIYPAIFRELSVAIENAPDDGPEVVPGPPDTRNIWTPGPPETLRVPSRE